MTTNSNHRSDRARRLAAALLASATLATSCGGSDAASGDDTVGAAPTTATVAESTTTAPPTSESTTTTVAETTTTTEATTTSSTSTTAAGGGGVPGEPLDFGPSVGTGLAVVGVRYDDVLNFRADPSPSADILRTAPPLSPDLDIAALGEAWSAPSGVWWKVALLGEEAWANQRFLGSLGSPVDIFDDVASELGVLMFEDVEDAALAVAETRASIDPESDIVFAGEPLAFDTGDGFAIVDVMGLGDDSVKGERLRVEVELAFDEDSEEGEPIVAFVVLTGVELTPICGRGTSGGLCV